MLDLLHIEDDDSMALLLRVALGEAHIDVFVHRVADGEQGLKFLRMLEPYEKVRRPNIIFLDLNMPRMNGWQVLGEIQSDSSLRSIPVVVLSSEAHSGDRVQIFSLGARHFISKPFVFRDWVFEIQTAWTKIFP